MSGRSHRITQRAVALACLAVVSSACGVRWSAEQRQAVLSRLNRTSRVAATDLTGSRSPSAAAAGSAGATTAGTSDGAAGTTTGVAQGAPGALRRDSATGPATRPASGNTGTKP